MDHRDDRQDDRDHHQGDRYDSMEERRHFSRPLRYNGTTGEVSRKIPNSDEWEVVARLKS